MRKIIAICQYRENYGWGSGTEYWKDKGGFSFEVKVSSDDFESFMYLDHEQRIVFLQYLVDKYVCNVNGTNHLTNYKVVEYNPVFNEPGTIDPDPDSVEKAFASLLK